MTDYNMGKPEDFSLFIPYEELHVSNAGRQNLKFFIRILQGTRTVVNSDWSKFFYGK
jgi:hypothetical protein